MGEPELEIKIALMDELVNRSRQVIENESIWQVAYSSSNELSFYKKK